MNSLNKDISNIIKNSLEYYDNNQIKNNKFINKIKYIKTINNENVTDEIIFYDKNKKKIFKSRFELLAQYLPSKQIWKWAWSIPSMPKKDSLISRNIINYAFDLEETNKYPLKEILINSNINIKNNNQLDINIALSSFLTKIPLILKYYAIPNSNSNDNELFEFNHNIQDDNAIVMYLFIIDF